jgi:hypothetical protein
MADREVDVSRLTQTMPQQGHPERVEGGRSAETPMSPEMRDRLDPHVCDLAKNG